MYEYTLFSCITPGADNLLCFQLLRGGHQQGCIRQTLLRPHTTHRAVCRLQVIKAQAYIWPKVGHTLIFTLDTGLVG